MKQSRSIELQIDLGRSRRIGDMNSTFGLWIEGGSNHRIRNVEAFGDGKNSLISIWATSGSSYDNLLVRDAEFDDASASDDVMQGVWLYGNWDCILHNPVVSNLTGNASYVGRPFANLRTRGIALSKNTRVSIIEPKVDNVDQGIDVTGSDGNVQCVISGGHSSDCGSVGLSSPTVPWSVAPSAMLPSGVECTASWRPVRLKPTFGSRRKIAHSLTARRWTPAIIAFPFLLLRVSSSAAAIMTWTFQNAFVSSAVAR